MDLTIRDRITITKIRCPRIAPEYIVLDSSKAIEHDATMLVCHRCGVTLTPGAGDFFVVRIEAVADPTPPNVSREDLETDLHSRVNKLIAQMQDLSEQELIDQVYRRLTIYLCARCHSHWIEDPAR